MLIRKNRWRTWFGLKGELWYYDGPERFADKPHPTTVRLALFAPVLAAVAVTISLVSFQRSDENARIAQRGYLALNVTEYGLTPANLRDKISTEEFSARLYIKNLGNTPAYVDSATNGFVTLHDEAQKGSSGRMLNIGSISPRDEYRATATTVISRDGLTVSKLNQLEYVAEVKWHDVFGVSHRDVLCKRFYLEQEALLMNDCPIYRH